MVFMFLSNPTRSSGSNLLLAANTFRCASFPWQSNSSTLVESTSTLVESTSTLVESTSTLVESTSTLVENTNVSLLF